MPVKIVGIVNLTEDSFSDGGRFLAPDAALEHAAALLAAGADIIELGPASSNPEARAVDADEEIRRVAPVLAGLVAQGVEVSIDSWQPRTQTYAVEHGARYVNDVRGFGNSAVYPFLRSADCRLIVMHSLHAQPRATREPAGVGEVVAGLQRFFDARIDELVRSGIGRDRLILDPGMGLFLGSNPEPSVTVLKNLAGLRRRYGLPLFVSVSRKSFLGALTGRSLSERGAATLAAELWAVLSGVEFVRTHDVATLRDALAVLSAIEAAPHVDLAE